MSVRDELCGRTIGDFVLRERIGEGGFGAIYRCEQPLLGREAIIKVLRGALRASDVMMQRFLREARLASRLDHPFAAHVYAFGVERDDGLLWIAMEMVHGTPLDRWLRERGPMPIAALVPLFERIAEVVQTAHERGIVHRDLKPSNVMVIERAGQLLPKLLDFGIAKLFARDAAAGGPRIDRTAGGAKPPAASAALDGDTVTLTADPDAGDAASGPVELTAPGAALGSPPYMAPEQWGDDAVGPGADLYALGVLAYEAVSGRRPFDATTLHGYAALHATQPVPPLGGDHAAALDPWFARALAKRVADRPRSALELAAALRVVAGLGDPPAALPQLDRGVRYAWISDAPRPLAEAVAALDDARDAHEARTAAVELRRALVSYLLVLALAARAQAQRAPPDASADELLRALRDRELDERDRVRLIRSLVRPFAASPGAHPLPALVELFAQGDRDGAGDGDGEGAGDDPLDRALAVASAGAPHGIAEAALRSQLAELVPALGRVLRAAAFVLDHPLIAGRAGAAERWTGIRRSPRPAAMAIGFEPVDHQPLLVDRDGRRTLVLWPLVQVAPPAPGADDELFVFDGRGRRGARLVAAPGGFERHDPALWDWLGERVPADAAAGAPPAPEPGAPYRGLEVFSAEDADRFVGRERELDGFVNRLRTNALQVVVGASGAGKSSFVYAGVVPALPPGWRAIAMRPGARPLAALAARLAAAGLAIDLDDPAAAAAVLAARAASDGPIALIVDQLEELFTLCRDPASRDQFAAVLDAATAGPDPAIRVIGTLRDDFMMRAAGLPALAHRIAASVFLLGNPSRDDLIRIVVEPARRAGYALSDATLARDMADAVAGSPGALALLSFTASRLWELRDRERRQLTRAAYDAMGGVAGALGQHAEATLAAMAESDQRIVREVFRHLVTAEGTRDRLAVTELRGAIAGAPSDGAIGDARSVEQAGEVIDALVAARLLVVAEHDDGQRVEIVHEALLAAWPRARQWLHEDSDAARLRGQLRAAARPWDDRGRIRGLLWRGEAVIDLERWRGRGGAHGLTAVEAAFVAASLAEAARGRRRRRGGVIGAFAALVAGLVVLVSLRARAVEAGEIAERERRAREHQLAESYEEQGRRALLDGDTRTALVELDAAAQLGLDTPVLRYMIARALDPIDAEVATLRHGARLKVAAFAPDGERVLTAGEDGVVRIWDPRAARELARLDGAPGAVDAVWSRDGEQVATLDTAGQIRIWRPATGASTTIAYADGPLRYPRIRFSPDGRFVVAAEPSRDPAIFALGSARRVAPLTGGGSVIEVEFSPDGALVIGAGSNGACTLWRASGERVTALVGHTDAVWRARFSPDGTLIATASLDGTARIWSAATGAPLRVLRDHERRVTDVAFSPDGAIIATASADRTVRLWDVATGAPRATLRGHTAQVNRVAFTPDGADVISVGVDGSVRVWDARLGDEIAALAHPGFLADLGVSADGTRAVTASQTGTARIFALDRGRRIAAWPVDSAAFEGVPLSSTTAAVLVGDGDGALAIDLASRQARRIAAPGLVAGDLGRAGELVALARSGGGVQIARLGGGGALAITAHRGAAGAVAIAPDGGTVVTAGEDRDVALWRVDSGAATRRRSLAAAVDTLRFSGDGQTVVAYARETATRPVVLSAATLDVVARLGDPAGDVHDVAISPDSRRVAIAAGDVTVWTTDGAFVARLGEPAVPRTVAWSPDAARLLVGRFDGSAVLWDVDGSRRQRLAAHDSFVTSVAFSPDGALFATVGGDHTVVVGDAALFRPLFRLALRDTVRARFAGDQLWTAGLRDVGLWRADRATVDAGALSRIVRCRLGLELRDGRVVDRSELCPPE